jgi:hypothetical protein
MKEKSTICGRVVASIWLACAAFCLLIDFLDLTFIPRTHSPSDPVNLANSFWDNRLAIISLTGIALIFLTAASGILLRQGWSKGLSLFLCVFVICYSVGGLLFQQMFTIVRFYSATAVVLTATSIAVLMWLFSRSGRVYFERASQSA